jgi:hypothetical protein
MAAEPPEGFWDDLQAYVLKQFEKGKEPPTQPPPDPKTDPPSASEPPTDSPKEPKKRKSWFSDES